MKKTLHFLPYFLHASVVNPPFFVLPPYHFFLLRLTFIATAHQIGDAELFSIREVCPSGERVFDLIIRVENDHETAAYANTDDVRSVLSAQVDEVLTRHIS